MRKSTLLICLLVLIGLSACGGGRNKLKLTFSERIKYAKELFDKGKNFEARTQFQILVLNNPGGRLVDMAQFYYAECSFNMKEYIIAASEYEKLISLYPRSEFIDDSRFKIGLCNFYLSPKSSLDQKYTYKAIDAFQFLMDEYPESEHISEATEKLGECRKKLAKKEYDAGEHYRKQQYFNAAIIYYDEVLKNFFDTEFVEHTYYFKAVCQYELGRLKEARVNLQILLSKFKDTKHKEDARRLVSEIDDVLKRGQKS